MRVVLAFTCDAAARTTANASSMGAKEFVELLRAQLQLQGRTIRIRNEPSWGPRKEDEVYINFVNLPEGVGGAGGGAEAENNRASFWVRGFGAGNAPPPSGKVKVEQSNSALYKGSSYSRENRVPFRAKTGTPEQVAAYLAAFLNKVVREVEPRYTHTQPPGGTQARTTRGGRTAMSGQRVMVTREEQENIIKTTQLAAKYSREEPKKIATLVSMLFTNARRLHRYNMTETNDRNLYPHEKRDEEERMQTVGKIAGKLGARKVEFGDPRGYTVHLVWPGGESNNWGGDWGIV